MEKTSTQILIEKGEEPTKFLLVGLSGVFINYLVVFVSNSILNFSVTLSFLLAIIISMTTNYIFNRIWTFESSNPILAEYLKYVVANSLGAIIQFGTSITIVYIFGENWELDVILIPLSIVYIALSIGIVLGFISNYALSKFYVFNLQQTS